MGLIGTIASIITLISFIIYFTGKIIKIKISKKLIFEDIQVHYNLDKVNQELKIVEEFDVGANNTENLIISSKDPINWIKIYECDWHDSKNSIIKGNLVEEYGFLKAGHTIQINTYLPCGMPAYLVEFERYDYLLGSFCISENSKNGVLDEFIKMTHTFKSYMYYIFE